MVKKTKKKIDIKLILFIAIVIAIVGGIIYLGLISDQPDPDTIDTEKICIESGGTVEGIQCVCMQDNCIDIYSFKLDLIPDRIKNNETLLGCNTPPLPCQIY